MIRSQAMPIPAQLLGERDHRKSLVRSDLRTAAEDEMGRHCVAGSQRLMPQGIQCILEASAKEKRAVGANVSWATSVTVMPWHGRKG